MVARPSLRGRIALAIALLVGFYVIALAIIAGLLFVPYAEFQYLDSQNGATLKLGFICIAGALAIARGILPRWDKFERPGPEITEADQPRLFAVVKDVAQATEQAMPEDVYLVGEMNAFVMQRGGVMGVRSRRVMGIGLPLLEALTIEQFRAVVAHEFGHYYGGDTKLGPWIYKTRAAIMRTLYNIARHRAGRLLQLPFVWYGKAFSRVTLAVSRRQEYVADELAARTSGAANLAAALRELERSSNAFGAYMRDEYAAVVNHGFRPPFVEGLAQFRAAPRVSHQLDKLLAAAEAQGEAGPYDTHPSLKQRLAALAEVHDSSARRDDGLKAISLVDDVARLEALVIGSLLKSGTPELTPISWDDVPTRVLNTAWVELVRASRPGLEGLTPARFVEIAHRLASDPDVLARQLGVPRSGDQPNLWRNRAESIAGSALALALDARRAASPDRLRVSARPGEPVLFHVVGDAGETSIEPFSVLSRLQSGELATGDWTAACQAAGITSDDLGAVANRAVEQRDREKASAVLSRR